MIQKSNILCIARPAIIKPSYENRFHFIGLARSLAGRPVRHPVRRRLGEAGSIWMGAEVKSKGAKLKDE